MPSFKWLVSITTNGSSEETPDLLDPNTLPTSFREGHEIAIKTDTLFLRFNPSLRFEGERLGKHHWVHVDEVVGFTNGCLQATELVIGTDISAVSYYSLRLVGFPTPYI
jgi:hypothetical protein